MKRVTLAFLFLIVLAAAAFLALSRPTAEATPAFTITVDSVTEVTAPNIVVSLREAMLLATGNLTLADLTEGECDQVSDTYWSHIPFPAHCESTGKYDPGAASADTIVFDTAEFPPGSPTTISLGSGLPALDTGGDTVDGSAAGVVVDGGGYLVCFRLESANNTIKGLVIHSCVKGVRVFSAANNTIGGGNVIYGNTNGVDIAGSSPGNLIGVNTSLTASPNVLGVLIDRAQDTIVSENAISGNDMTGITIFGSEHTTVTGNVIGTDPNGTAVLPNGGAGVLIGYGAHENAAALITTTGTSSPSTTTTACW